jgi:CTP-dependent riboflavin kinase
MEKVKKYRGTIFSGIGVAQIRVADNLDLYEKKTRMRFFPGTLNVRVAEEFTLPKNRIDIAAEEIVTTGRKSKMSLVPASLFGEAVVLLYPHNALYGRSVIEIMAPFNVRTRFGLHDGDEIEIEVAK